MKKIDILKKAYNLQGKTVRWAVIEEKTDDEVEYKLGLLIKGSRLYVDVIARRLYTALNWPEISRQVYEARVIPSGDVIVFEDKKDANKRVVMPKTFFEDIYGGTVYDPSLEDRLLL